MKNPRVRTFNALLSRRQRLVDQLRVQLSAEREQHRQRLDAKRSADETLDDAKAQERACDARIDALLSGREPVRLPDINAQREHRETLVQRRTLLERRARESAELVRQSEAQLRDTRERLARNEQSLDFYREQLLRIQREAQTREDEQADEEAEEASTARRGAVRRGRRQAELIDE